MNIQDRFWELCGEATAKFDECRDHRKIEPILLKILFLAKENPIEKAFFINAFTKILQNPGKWTNLIVTFCMRELRFSEVYEKAIELEKTQPFDDAAAQDVIRVYRPIWPFGHSYEYYRKKEPPLNFNDINFTKPEYFYHRLKGILKRFLSNRFRRRGG